ncbi:MAG: peptide-binding protein [Victivallaceae bacterium]|nr:peptide-binding protein [Victivallaceae bacterium]
MNKNLYLNFAVTAVAIITALGLWQLFVSLDALRFSNERLTTEVKSLNERLDSLSLAPSAAMRRTDDGEFANAEFFDPAAQPGGRMRTAIAAWPDNFNPILSADHTSRIIQNYVNATLAKRNDADPNVYEGVLAESWEESPDHLSYRIKLRPNIYWQDFTDPVTGEEFRNVPVTSEDFKFYVDVIKNEEVNCAALRNYLADLDSVEVISDREFVVKWKSPYFLTLASTLEMEPLPRKLYWNYPGKFDPARFNDDHARNAMMVGCGPYKLVKMERNQRVVLQRFDRYIGERFGAAPALKELEFEVVSHPNTRFQMLMAGDLDVLPLTPEQWVNRTGVPEFSDTGTLVKVKAPRLAYFYLGWNLRNPMFADARVRNALTMLVNRPKIIEDVFYGLAQIQTGPFYLGTPPCDPEVKPLPFDPEQARKLLAECDWRDSDGDGILDRDGVKFEFSLTYPADSPTTERMLTIIKEDMAAAGIDMQMQSFEWSVFQQKVDERAFDCYFMGWASMSFEQDPYQIWHSSQAELKSGSNYIGFKNPEADRLIEEIRREFDSAKRNELCHQLQQLIHREQPYTFLVAPAQLLAYPRRYRNLRVFPLGVDNQLLWTPRQLQKSL